MLSLSDEEMCRLKVHPSVKDRAGKYLHSSTRDNATQHVIMIENANNVTVLIRVVEGMCIHEKQPQNQDRMK